VIIRAPPSRRRKSRYRNGCCSARNLCPRHAEIARRYRSRKPRPTFEDHRVDDIEIVVQRKYDDVLPNNTLGQKFVFALANYMIDPSTKLVDANRLKLRLGEIAPWHFEDEIDALITRLNAKQYRFSADKIARLLKVTWEESRAFGLKTIGGCDVTKKARKADRDASYRSRKRELDHQWRENQRRADGVQPREEWLAKNSASREQPWKAVGMGRTKYYEWLRAVKDSLPGGGADRCVVETYLKLALMNVGPVREGLHPRRTR
jgi:hypothetical protein